MKDERVTMNDGGKCDDVILSVTKDLRLVAVFREILHFVQNDGNEQSAAIGRTFLTSVTLSTFSTK